MTGTGLRRAVFLDKDGTLVEDVPFNVDVTLLRFTPHAFEALRQLSHAGFALVVVSNQSGLATGRFDAAAWARLRAAIIETLSAEGIVLDGFEWCPHAPDAQGRPACSCRKPAPGMLRRAADSLAIDLARSWMVGDILDDVEAGQRAGCRTVMVDNGNETVWATGPGREPHHRVSDLREAARAILADDAR